MNETSRDSLVKVTPGMRNAMMKGKTIARRCRKCRQAFPAYPGRYPSTCPHCGGSVGGSAANESAEGPLSVVCASMVPRLQRLIDRGQAIVEGESFVSPIMVVSFADIEESVPGGIKGLKWFLEETQIEGVYYRVESPEDPVLILEVDASGRRALVLATTEPTRFLGFDPRAELVEQELAPIEEQGGGPGGARASYSRNTRKSVLSKPPEAGKGAHRVHGGFRFEIGKNKKRKPRKDVALSIQNRLNAARGTASRIRAAKKWHRSALGGEYHRALGRYNQNNHRGESVEESNMIDWVRAAKDVLRKSTGTTQFDLGYRMYLRAVIMGQPSGHLLKLGGDKGAGATQARQDLIDRAGMGESVEGEAVTVISENYREKARLVGERPVNRDLAKWADKALRSMKPRRPTDPLPEMALKWSLPGGYRQDYWLDDDNSRGGWSLATNMGYLAGGHIRHEVYDRLVAHHPEHGWVIAGLSWQEAYSETEKGFYDFFRWYVPWEDDPFEESAPVKSSLTEQTEAGGSQSTTQAGATQRSVDDIFEAMLRKLVFIESTDILQDVEFTDDGSIYFFFDPSIPRPEMDEVVMKLAEENNRAQLVASPDMTLEGETAKSDWWVVFVPINEEATADPEVYGSDDDEMLADKEPPTQQMVTKAITPVDQIGMNLDTDKLVQAVGESVDEREGGYYGVSHLSGSGYQSRPVSRRAQKIIDEIISDINDVVDFGKKFYVGGYYSSGSDVRVWREWVNAGRPGRASQFRIVATGPSDVEIEDENDYDGVRHEEGPIQTLRSGVFTYDDPNPSGAGDEKFWEAVKKMIRGRRVRMEHREVASNLEESEDLIAFNTALAKFKVWAEPVKEESVVMIEKPVPIEERLQKPSPKGYHGAEARDLYNDLYNTLRVKLRGIRGVTVEPAGHYTDPYRQLPTDQYAVRVGVHDPMTDFEPAEVFLVFLEKGTGAWYYNSYNVSQSTPGQEAPVPRREMTWSNMPVKRGADFAAKIKRTSDYYSRRAAHQLQAVESVEFDDSAITEAAVAKLEEGIFDPYILKAVFLAGGGGSGKGFIGGHLFGGLGLVSVNPDRALEARLNAEIKALRTGTINNKIEKLLHGVISGDIATGKLRGVNPKTGEEVISSIPPDALERLRTASVGSDAYKAAEKEVFNAILGSDYGQDVVRPWVKAKRDQQRKNYVAGRLGLLIDGTAADPNKVRKEKAELEALGYDTYMIFVDTAMDVALARNRMRKRHVPEEHVISDWNNVRANLPSYKAMWGKDFVRIDNTTARTPDEIEKILGPDLRRIAKTLIARPLRNPIGWDWLRNEARLLGVDHSKVTWLSGRGAGSRGGAAGAFRTPVQKVAARLSGESHDPYLFWLRAGSGEPKMQGKLTEEALAEYSGLAAKGEGRLFVVQAESVAAARRIIDVGKGLKQTAPNVFSNEG